jgi:hypothetical protein
MKKIKRISALLSVFLIILFTPISAYASTETAEQPEYVLFAVGGAVGGGIIVTVCMVLYENAKHRPAKMARHADLYVMKDEVKLTANEDTFLRTSSTRVKVRSSSK